MGDSVARERENLSLSDDNQQHRPYSDGQTTPEENGQRTFSYLAAAEMAMEHLRTRNFHSIVSPLEEDKLLPCGVNKVFPFSDGRPIDVYDGFNDTLIRDVVSHGNYAGSSSTERRQLESSNSDSDSEADYDPPPCAFLGPFDDTSVTMWSMWSVISSTPLFALGGTTSSPSITDRSVVPFTFRDTVRVDDYVKVVVEYLLPREFVAVLYDSYDFVSSMMIPYLEASAERQGLTVKSHPFSQATTSSRLQGGEDLQSPTAAPISTTAKAAAGTTTTETAASAEDLTAVSVDKTFCDTGIEQALLRIKYRGYHTVLVSVQQRANYLEKIAAVADRLGLLGPEYLWIFTSSTVRHVDSELPREVPDSPVDKLLRGAGVIHILDGFDGKHGGTADDDAFLTEWRRQDASIFERARSQMEHFKGSAEYFLPPSGDDYFQTTRPAPFSSFVYDMTVAAGFASCGAVASLGDDGIAVEDGDDFISKRVQTAIQNIVPEIMKTDFHGASGRMRFDAEHRGRNVDDVTPGMYNIRPNKVDAFDGKRGYHLVVTSTRAADGWHDLEDEEFIYFDGTTNEPQVLRDVVDPHYLPNGARAMALVCSGSLILCCAIAAVIFIVFRNDPIIVSADPTFLLLFCTGTAVKTSTIYFRSQDESDGWTDRELDMFCRLQSWPFPVGSIFIDAAILIKAYQILRLTGEESSSGSRHVNLLHACKMIMIVFNVMLIAFLCFHTAVDPPVWVRDVLVQFPLETVGQCTERLSHGSGLLVFGILMLKKLIAIIALHQSCTNLAQLSAGTKGCLRWILWGIGVRAQGLFVGMPLILTLRQSSPEGLYIGAVSILWSFGVSAFALIAGSVIYRLIASHFFPSTSLPSSEESLSLSGSSPSISKDNASVGSFTSSSFKGRSKIKSKRGSFSSVGSEEKHVSDRSTGPSTGKSKDQQPYSEVTSENRNCEESLSESGRGRTTSEGTNLHESGSSLPHLRLYDVPEEDEIQSDASTATGDKFVDSACVSHRFDEGSSESERMLVGARRKLRELELEVMRLHLSRMEYSMEYSSSS